MDGDPALQVSRVGRTASDGAVQASLPDGGDGEATVTGGGGGTARLDRFQPKRRPRNVLGKSGIGGVFGR